MIKGEKTRGVGGGWQKSIWGPAPWIPSTSVSSSRVSRTVCFHTWHLISWREQKTDEKFWLGRLRCLMFTNRFDNRKLIWAISVQYQSDTKWVGEQKGIIHVCLNSIAANLFIIRLLTYNPHSRSVQFFFRSRQEIKCHVWKKTVFLGKGPACRLSKWLRFQNYHDLRGSHVHSYYLPMDSWPSSVSQKNIKISTPTTHPSRHPCTQCNSNYLGSWCLTLMSGRPMYPN